MNSSHSLLLLFAVFALLFSPSQSDDINSDQSALLALRSSLTPLTSRWNSSSSPCSWQGIVCSSNRVTEIHLPGSRLRGQIPLGTIGNLSALQFLSLRFNQISGSLPSDLANCAQLRNLNLERNRLSGEIPKELFSLPLLTRLNLASNNFSGPFSPEFNNLTKLKTLYLENNQLSGPIPDLKGTNLELFNVSYNQLNGSVPTSLQKFTKSSFLGMSICGGPLGPCAGSPSPSPSPSLSPSTSPANGVSPPGPTANSGESKKSKSSKLSGGAIAGIAIGSVFGILLILALLVCLCRNRKNQQKETTETQKRQTGAPPAPKPVPAPVSSVPVPTGGKKNLTFLGNTPKLYDLEDLLRASAEVLGKGTFGTTYKAILESGPAVAVKRMKDANLPEREFREKMAEIGTMQHENLVPVQSYYYSKDEKLVVSEFVASGSLSSLLHGNKGSGRDPLNFETRTRIALSAARGISYIHSSSPKATHGNIKSSNILLSNRTSARISDYGLAQLITSNTPPNRASGYRAPEVTDIRKISQKSDVYSFGVVLLELVSGKDERDDLPRWVRSVVKEGNKEEVFDGEIVGEANQEEMVGFLELGLDCTEQYLDQRPSMSEVVARIEEIRAGLGRARSD